MFIRYLIAETNQAAAFDWMKLVPFLLIFVVFYIFLIKPQSDKSKAHQEMINSLKKGQRVLTESGLIGKIIKCGEGNEITLEISDGVKIQYLKNMVQKKLD